MVPGHLRAKGNLIHRIQGAGTVRPTVCGLRGYHFFVVVATLDLKRFLPYPTLLSPLLIRYSVCCTFNQHTGLFLQCTIKELFLCLTALISQLRLGGKRELAFCLCWLEKGGGDSSFGWRGKEAVWRPPWIGLK